MELADLDDTIGLIYEAALDPEVWPRVLARVSGLGRGEHTTLFVFQASTGRLVHALVSEHVTTEPAAREAYLAHYAALDPRNAYGIRQSAGTRFTDYAFITEAEMARSEFYHDYLWPNGLGYVGATSLKADSDSIVGLAIHRSRRQGAFELRELDFLNRLAPHLLRALRLQTCFAELEARRWADRTLRDRLPFAVILVDERGRVVSLNEAAVRLLAAGDGLIERRRLLFAAHPTDQAALDHLIKNAVATAQERGTEGGGIVALRRRSARRPLAATVLPIRRRGPALSIDFGARHPVVLVIITDPDAAPNPPTAVLRRLYGLTPAEAALARALAAGRSLQECADEMGLTTETARWRLKRILAKTDTHRQAELVRLLVSGSALA